MDKNLNITEEFSDAVKWTLIELQKEVTATADDRYVCYLYQETNSAPKIEDQRRAIKFLEINQALKIQKNKYRRDLMDDRIAEILKEKTTGVYVSIKQSNFDKFFNLFTKEKRRELHNNLEEQDLFWVLKKPNGDFSFNGSDVYIRNKNAQYVVIFEVAFSIKPKGGGIKYEEIIRGCKTRGRKIAKTAIFKALTGKDATFFYYTKGINQTPAFGIDLFVASPTGKEIQFNNKK